MDEEEDVMDSSPVIVMCMLKMKKIKHEIKLINHKYNDYELSKSIQFYGAKISDFEKSLYVFNAKIKGLDNVRSENEELKPKTRNLSFRFEALEQFEF